MAPPHLPVRAPVSSLSKAPPHTTGKVLPSMWVVIVLDGAVHPGPVLSGRSSHLWVGLMRGPAGEHVWAPVGAA